MRHRRNRPTALAVGLAASFALLVAVSPAAALSVQLVPFGGQTFSSPYYVTGASTVTGQRAAALKKCKKKHRATPKKCKKKANLFPV